MAIDFSTNIESLVDTLRKKNGGIAAMDYFYDFSKRLFSGYIDEMKTKDVKIIGTLCNFVPDELILAAGALPIRLCSGFRSTVSRAEQIMPANFCPMIKSSYGMFLEDGPTFKISDVVVIPTTCDGKKKMAELIADIKPTWLIEVPHTTETSAARELWLKSIITLKKELQKLTGIKITQASLRKSIELCNSKRAAIRRLYELRKKKDIPIWGRDVMLVTNISFYDDCRHYIEHVHALCDELEQRQESVSGIAQRVLLTGSPVLLPALKIANVIEDSNLVIVADDLCTGSKIFHDPVMPRHWNMDDMLIALADKYLMNTCPCFTPNTARSIRLQQMAKDYDVKGLVYYILQACHTYNIECWNIQKIFKSMSIPTLKIETDYGDQDVAQLKVRMEAFSEMIHGQI